jgi:ribosomal protein S18 acetylase RimI-like enzyme
MSAILMRKSLASQPPGPRWPPGVRYGFFGESEALSVHQLFTRAYANGEGWVGDFEGWWRSLITDSEFDPGLCLAAYSGNGRVLAAAQLWTSAFIKDFAVDASLRRQGLGTALLNQCFTVLWARGAPLAMLKVKPENTAARAFYARAGMVEVPDLSRG